MHKFSQTWIKLKFRSQFVSFCFVNHSWKERDRKKELVVSRNNFVPQNQIDNGVDFFVRKWKSWLGQQKTLEPFVKSLIPSSDFDLFRRLSIDSLIKFWLIEIRTMARSFIVKRFFWLQLNHHKNSNSRLTFVRFSHPESRVTIWF